MTLPRVGLGGMMTIVAVIALDLAAGIPLVRSSSPFSRHILLDILPMLNVLAFAGYFAVSRQGCRPFIQGFLVAGTVATIGIIIWNWFAADSFQGIYISVYEPIRIASGLHPEGWQWFLHFLIASAITVVPQLGIAVAGGIVSAALRRG